ncbi:hypothetical protein Tsp_10519 [Trichinella spiralis]|uniref:hypothetical protein n=1 Tax=Trichinella spiralis TaxID=6334 RepID=UPI0001EFD569|nr:hypothetical protein Tsp_10519 [Trichinella spiralis]
MVRCAAEKLITFEKQRKAHSQPVSYSFKTNFSKRIHFYSARRLIFNDYKPQQRLAQICLARLDGWKQRFHSTIANKINSCLIAHNSINSPSAFVDLPVRTTCEYCGSRTKLVILRSSILNQGLIVHSTIIDE